MKKQRIRITSQIVIVCAALHGCSANRAPEPNLSGTVIQGVDDAFKDAGSGEHQDAAVGSVATGNGAVPPSDMMANGSGGSPASGGSGGQPGNLPDAGMPAMGSGGNAGNVPSVDAGSGDDDDDVSPDAAVDGGSDAGGLDDDESDDE